MFVQEVDSNPPLEKAAAETTAKTNDKAMITFCMFGINKSKKKGYKLILPHVG